jgi:hypothetical protein
MCWWKRFSDNIATALTVELPRQRSASWSCIRLRQWTAAQGELRRRSSDITTDAATLTVKTRTSNDATASAPVANMTLLGGGTGAKAEASVTEADNEASIGSSASIQVTGLVLVDAGQTTDNVAGAHAFGVSGGIINSGSVKYFGSHRRSRAGQRWMASSRVAAH